VATPTRPSRKRSAGTRGRRNERAGAGPGPLPHGGSPTGRAAPASPLHGTDPTIDLDLPLPASVRALFEGPLKEALGGRARACAVKLEHGRRDGEVVARITSEGRPGELPLYFPDMQALRPEDVLRIVRSVLEGMGPAAP